MGNLSPAERRVVELLGLGMSQKKIAEVLGLSMRTVYVHVQNARRKAQCADTFQLAVKTAVQSEMRRRGIV